MSSSAVYTARKQVTVLRRTHYALLFLLALLSVLVIAGQGWFVNYHSYFQMGFFGYNHILTGLFIGYYLAASLALRQPWNQAQAHDGLTMEEAAVLQEYEVFASVKWIMGTVAFIAIFCIAIYLYNLIYILVRVCPKHHHHPPHVISFSEREGSPMPPAATPDSFLEILVAMDYVPDGEEFYKKSVVVLRYNEQRKELEFRERDGKARAEDVWQVTSKAVDERQPRAETQLCIKTNKTRYLLLEEEIRQLLQDNLEARRRMKAMRISSEHNSQHISNEEEDSIFLDLFLKSICRNEYGFTIGLITVLSLAALLDCVIIGYYLWINAAIQSF